MRDNRTIRFGLMLLLLTGASQAQQPEPPVAGEPNREGGQTEPAAQSRPAGSRQQAATVQVDISTTISGNQEQPRTLYVLPWQDSIAQIRIPAPDIKVVAEPITPLDRQQFLRFIEAQSLQQQPASNVSTNNK